jgi:hypothetical protein
MLVAAFIDPSDHRKCVSEGATHAVESLPGTELFMLVAACLGCFGLLELGLAQVTNGHILAVAVSFLALPALWLWYRGRAQDLGGLDAGLLSGLALYLAFTVWVLLYVPRDPGFFLDFQDPNASAPEVLASVLLTAVHVMPVDYFCRRVVQLEAERHWGPWWGFATATCAWGLGHVVEWFWLKELMGPLGATAFIAVAGVTTGLLYMKWHNAIGLMLGHAALNWAVILFSVAGWIPREY